MSSNEPLLTPSQVADRLGITKALVYRYIVQERLPHVIKYGRKLIDPDALATFASKPRKVGRPAKENKADG